MSAGASVLDFEAFHRDELPRRLARWGPLALRLPEGPAFSLIPEPDGMRVAAGDGDAETLVELDPEGWQGLVQDLESVPGLLYAGRGDAKPAEDSR